MMFQGSKIEAYCPSASEFVNGSVDVDVCITTPDGAVINGGVTLAPAAYDGELRAAGDCPEQWLEGTLIDWVDQQEVAHDAYDAIEFVTARAAMGVCDTR